jgi:hypothetical protein
MVTVAAEVGRVQPLFPKSLRLALILTMTLQGGFIKSFMDFVVPLVRDNSLLVSSEGVAAMTKHMCDKGNGKAAIAWLLTCRGSGAAIDQRWASL